MFGVNLSTLNFAGIQNKASLATSQKHNKIILIALTILSALASVAIVARHFYKKFHVSSQPVVNPQKPVKPVISKSQAKKDLESKQQQDQQLAAKKSEAEDKQKAEESQKKLEAEAKKRKEAEDKQKAEESQKKLEAEAKKRKEAEDKQKAEEAQKKLEAEAKKRKEAEDKQKAEEAQKKLEKKEELKLDQLIGDSAEDLDIDSDDELDVEDGKTGKPNLDIMKFLRQSRLENVEDELQRLRSQGTLPVDLEEKVDNALVIVEGYKQSSEPRANQQAVKVILGRVLEIKNLYQDTYDVFTHAQASEWYVITCLIKELAKLYFPKKDMHAFKFLRTPYLTDTLAVAEYKSILNQANEKSAFNDHTGEFSLNLLSADGYFLSNEYCESALNFLCRNYSVFNKGNDCKKLKDIAISVVEEFHKEPISKSQLDSLGNEIVDIAKKINKSICGNLFVICVPKAMSSEVQYRSHKYGKPCDCHEGSKTDDLSILNDLQMNQVGKNRCKDGSIPQYRLLAANLKPEKGVLSFLLTPFAKAERQKIKQEIASIAQAVHQIK